MKDLDLIILQNLYENVSKYEYLGDCTDSFDKNNGECRFHYFTDVSDFARYAELAEDEMELEDKEQNGEIDENEFLSLVPNKNIPEKLKNKKDLKYYYYSNGLLVIYDQNSDIHYFFGKKYN
jgi:hypothetical protein